MVGRAVRAWDGAWVLASWVPPLTTAKTLVLVVLTTVRCIGFRMMHYPTEQASGSRGGAAPAAGASVACVWQQRCKDAGACVHCGTCSP